MHIDDTLLSKLERLSQLQIDENKRADTRSKLGEILNFVENLSSVELAPNAPSEERKTPLREDIAKDSQVRDDVLTHAPNARDSFFIVPKIIE